MSALLFVSGSSCFLGTNLRLSQDGKGMDCAATVPCKERPDGSQRRVPGRGGQEGQGEGQGCEIAPAESVRIRSQGGHHSAAYFKTMCACAGSGQRFWRSCRRRHQNSRTVECGFVTNATNPGWWRSSPLPLLKRSPPSWQSRWLRVVEDARRRRESIVAAKAFMHRRVSYLAIHILLKWL